MSSKKDEIILAAVNIFAEKGYTETSMKDIADAVSLRPGSLYSHFPSKMSILEQILDLYSKLLDQTVPDLVELLSQMDAKEILRKLFFSFPEDENKIYPKILKIILHEQYRNERIHQYMRDSFFTGLQTGIKDLLDKLIEAGKIRSIDTARYAKIINYISVASAVEYCHYTIEEYAASNPITQFDLLDLVLDIIVGEEGDKQE